MKSHINGIIAIIIFLTVVSLLILNKNRLRKYLDTQKFWIIFSTTWLVYFMALRYIPYLVQSSNGAEGSIVRGMLIQNIFMTNVCPAATMTIIIGSYFKKFRVNFGPSIAMVALFGGSLNMMAIIMNKNQDNIFSFIFFKTTVSYPTKEVVNNYLWFMTHLMLVVQAILLLMICKKVTMRHIGYVYLWGASFTLYVGILMGITGIRHDVGGLWINDWIKVGDYKGVFYQIGSIIWPSETHGWTSFAKAMSGVILLYAVGGVFIFLSWYFVNYENKESKLKSILRKSK